MIRSRLFPIAVLFVQLCSGKEPPKLPLKWTARINITAHHVDKTKDYPPWLKRMKVLYDYENKRFRAEFEHTNRTVIRRYDQGKEFLVTRVDEFIDCRKSKVRESMPAPSLPKEAFYVGEDFVLKEKCDHWQEDFGTLQVDVYFSITTGALVRVQVETVEKTEPVRLTVPDLTYDVFDFEEGSPDEELFGLPADVKGGEEGCERQPNDIGFPYVHVFHHYYRA